MTHGNGTYTTYAYFPTGDLSLLVNHGPWPTPDQDGPVNSSFAYTYDAAGRRTSMTTLMARQTTATTRRGS